MKFIDRTEEVRYLKETAELSKVSFLLFPLLAFEEWEKQGSFWNYYPKKTCTFL